MHAVNLDRLECYAGRHRSAYVAVALVSVWVLSGYVDVEAFFPSIAQESSACFHALV